MHEMVSANLLVVLTISFNRKQLSLLVEQQIRQRSADLFRNHHGQQVGAIYFPSTPSPVVLLLVTKIRRPRTSPTGLAALAHLTSKMFFAYNKGLAWDHEKLIINYSKFQGGMKAIQKTLNLSLAK
eukprot:TRINITY_DN9442_c0_g1_i1.p1 TRINITY_DN9442_c0_g1~~TRINITY_DN9442_c0_g1_i1.p1  ORF type:complete len:126 (-),score=5.53 TRINITY_DN9442_c0_g1_i1:16-393(-)